jgi:transposase
MDEQDPRLIPGINADDWEQTPVSVREVLKQLVLKVARLEQLEQRLKELESENQQLREQVERNSKNSHSPS